MDFNAPGEGGKALYRFRAEGAVVDGIISQPIGCSVWILWAHPAALLETSYEQLPVALHGMEHRG